MRILNYPLRSLSDVVTLAIQYLTLRVGLTPQPPTSPPDLFLAKAIVFRKTIPNACGKEAINYTCLCTLRSIDKLTYYLVHTTLSVDYKSFHFSTQRAILSHYTYYCSHILSHKCDS